MTQPTLTADRLAGTDDAVPARWWIRIDRDQTDVSLMVGPYPSDDAAVHAMEHAILIEGLCQEDCIDCYTICEEPSAADERVLINLDDPGDTGAGYTTDGEPIDGVDD